MRRLYTSAVRESRAGVTLLELLLVLAVLAISVAVVSLTLRVPTPASGPDSTWVKVRDLRARAIQAGRPFTEIISGDSRAQAVTAFPDGRVIGYLARPLQPLAGRKRGEP